MSQFQQPASQPTGAQYGPTQQATSQAAPQQSQAQQATPGQGGQVQQGQQQAGGGVQRARRFQTASYLTESVRDQIIQCLNRTLADATVLQTHARFAHWNVKGMSFHGLHETFEEIIEALEEHIDVIGERITALGGQAMGTAGLAVGACRLPQMPTEVYTGPQFVEVMVDRLSVFDATLARDIQTASELEDPDTADLLNEVSREVSKLRWFLEAHVRTQPVGTVGQEAGTGATGSEGISVQQQQATTQPGGGTQYQSQ